MVTNTQGFSLVELIVVITLIGIIAGIVVYAPISLQASARNQERSDDVSSITRRLEQAYSNQDMGIPVYPSTAEFLSDVSSRTRTGARLSVESVSAPGQSSSSLIAATSTSLTAPISGVITTKQYIYQPLTAGGGLCTGNPSTSSASNYCVRFNLYYKTETDNLLRKITSFHQQ